MNSQHADLPEWIYPGAHVAIFKARDSEGSADRGTVKRITATQIVVAVTAYRGTTEARFSRQPKIGLWTKKAPAYTLIRSGDYGSTYLLPPDDPRVNRIRFLRAMVDHWAALSQPSAKWFKGNAHGRTPELAMELLDEMENELRKARRTVESATLKAQERT